MSKFPENWVTTTLDEITHILRSGGTPKKGNSEYYENGEIPFIKIEDMSEDQKKLVINNYFITKKGLENSSAWMVPENSLIYSMYGSYGIPNITTYPVATNQAILGMTFPIKNIHLDYMYYILKKIKPEIKKTLRGTTQLNLSKTIVKDFEIPLPPYNEQVRIVSKIEELFSRLDSGVKTLQETQQQLDQYRQSILNVAFTGKLNEEWRQTHEIEYASKLLERILEEQKQIKKRRKIPVINNIDLFKIPENWAWTRVNDISYEIQYGTSEKSTTEVIGIPVLRMGNIQNGALIFKKIKYMPHNWFEKKKFLLVDGDVLFNRTNSAELVGKTAVYNINHPESVFASYLIRIKLMKQYYSPDLLSYFINSVHGRRYIKSVVSQQVGQANVNGTKLAQMPIPLIPVIEQKIILEELENRLQNVDKFQVAISKGIIQTVLLRQSVLRRAFVGGLVHQDIGDESASVLLDRIKAEKAKIKPKRGQGRKNH